MSGTFWYFMPFLAFFYFFNYFYGILILCIVDLTVAVYGGPQHSSANVTAADINVTIIARSPNRVKDAFLPTAAAKIGG